MGPPGPRQAPPEGSQTAIPTPPPRMHRFGAPNYGVKIAYAQGYE